MRAVQMLLIVLGAAGLFFFGAVIPQRVLNVGNLSGLFMSVLLLLGGFHLSGVCSFFVYAWSRKGAGTAVVVMLLGAISAILFLAVLISLKMAFAMRVRPKAGAPAIVLGCEVRGEKPSRALSSRIDAAAAYLQENETAVAILSGGKGSGERISEAACMQRELVKRGIAPERLYVEDTSRSTRENLINSGKILEEKGLGQDAAIVTSEFHCYRAMLIAKKEGISAGAVPAKTFWLYLPTFWVRELFGVLYEWQYGL